MSTDRKLKRQKAHGRMVVCPDCGNTADFKSDFTKPRTVFTCPKCQCEFDGDGNKGPFAVNCKECDTENPIKNEKCYMCGDNLAGAKAVLAEPEPKYVRCSNCQERNPKGAYQCARCGEHIGGDGQVLQVKES